MIAFAHHIIGFTARELGRNIYDSSQQQREELQGVLRRRFREICNTGCIMARQGIAPEHNRSTWEDDLAGDDQYVFLSVGSRYVNQIECASFGFVFDAEELIGRGALLGLHDLASDYTRIIGESAEEVAATLPRLPRISEAELDEFMKLMGEEDNAEMRQFISDQSTNPEHELLDALRDDNATYPGYSECMRLIKQRIAALHREKRLSGAAALEKLQQRSEDTGQLEILVRNRLPLAWAKGYIQAGKIKIPCKRCGRPLTNPKSIAAGIGPICQAKLDKANKV